MSEKILQNLSRPKPKANLRDDLSGRINMARDLDTPVFATMLIRKIFCILRDIINIIRDRGDG